MSPSALGVCETPLCLLTKNMDELMYGEKNKSPTPEEKNNKIIVVFFLM